jgi:hypothetical protein
VAVPKVPPPSAVGQLSEVLDSPEIAGSRLRARGDALGASRRSDPLHDRDGAHQVDLRRSDVDAHGRARYRGTLPARRHLLPFPRRAVRIRLLPLHGDSKSACERLDSKFSDPNASCGHRSAVSTRSVGAFYGYKLDLAVCTATDLPVAWNIRTARMPVMAPPVALARTLGRQRRELHLGVRGR